VGIGRADGLRRGRRVARGDVHVLGLALLGRGLLSLGEALGRGCRRRRRRRRGGGGGGRHRRHRRRGRGLLPAGVPVPVALALPLLPAALLVAAIPVPRRGDVVPTANAAVAPGTLAPVVAATASASTAAASTAAATATPAPLIRLPRGFAAVAVASAAAAAVRPRVGMFVVTCHT
jgi:hypothetical protein